MQYLLYYLITINIITFFVYGVDKWKSQKNKWRIPETHLFFWAFAGGSIGALSGMKFFRHKTLHRRFTIGIPLILLLQSAFIVYFSIKYSLI